MPIVHITIMMPRAAHQTARMTIDLARRSLVNCRSVNKATADWLKTTSPVLDYANAMVPTASPVATLHSHHKLAWNTGWQGALFPPYRYPFCSCQTYGQSLSCNHRMLPGMHGLQCLVYKTAQVHYVQTLSLRMATGTTSGLLGYMFWAAECRERALPARFRRQLVKAVWAWERRLIPSQFQCLR